MQDLKNQLLEQHIVLITTQEECDAVNALLRLDFKVLYYGTRGWRLYEFYNSSINIKDIVKIKKINSISIRDEFDYVGRCAIRINKTYVPCFLVNNLKLNILNE